MTSDYDDYIIHLSEFSFIKPIGLFKRFLLSIFDVSFTDCNLNSLYKGDTGKIECTSEHKCFYEITCKHECMNYKVAKEIYLTYHNSLIHECVHSYCDMLGIMDKEYSVPELEVIAINGTVKIFKDIFKYSLDENIYIDYLMINILSNEFNIDNKPKINNDIDELVKSISKDYERYKYKHMKS